VKIHVNSQLKPLLLVLFFLAIVAWFFNQDCAQAGEALPKAQVIEVNDGDTVTLRLNDKVYRTRLIGIDAPEMGQRPWGGRAKKNLIELMEHTAWTVFVETDVVKYDKYDRLLAYLWTTHDELINERMLLDGYAVLFTIQPNSKYVDRFKKAQRIARENKKEIWGPNGLKERPLDYKKAHPRK
jgi:micrococcal nuclease